MTPLLINCSRHASQRLQERFGVRWTMGLSVDLFRQMVESDGPMDTADLRGRGEPEGTTYWGVKIDGMKAVLVMTGEGIVRTVLRQLDFPDRPKRQRRRVQKKQTGKRPPRDYSTND